MFVSLYRKKHKKTMFVSYKKSKNERKLGRFSF